MRALGWPEKKRLRSEAQDLVRTNKMKVVQLGAKGLSHNLLIGTYRNRDRCRCRYCLHQSFKHDDMSRRRSR